MWLMGCLLVNSNNKNKIKNSKKDHLNITWWLTTENVCLICPEETYLLTAILWLNLFHSK